MGCANKIQKTTMWSGMLPELLHMISRKYIVYYEDYLTFSLVCKSWHSAAAQEGDNSNGPPSRFPSLLLAEKEEDGQEFRELFLLSTKSIRKIRLPEPYGKVCRSSCGWLINLGHDRATQLINPLSRETIDLPSLYIYDPEIYDDDEGIRKLLIVTNNSSSLKLALVMILGCLNLMGFCRPGDRDNNWTFVDKAFGICDFTYYNEQVYSFDWINHCIKACDVYGEDPTMLVEVSMLPSKLYPQNQHVRGAYIIGLDEDEKKRLLVVIRDSDRYLTQRFLLFAYDLKDGKWSRVKDFGKKTLFVGHSSSFWIEDTTGVIKNNCIYFTADFRFSRYASEDMGIYHLSDGTIEPHFVGESLSRRTPPTWLQSI